MSAVLSAITLLSAIITPSSSAEAAFIAATSSRNLLGPSQNQNPSISSHSTIKIESTHHYLIPAVASYSTPLSPTSISNSCLLAYRERSRYNDQRGTTRSGSSSKRDFDYEYDNAPPFDDDFDDDIFSNEYNPRQQQQQQGQSREGRMSNSKYELNNKRDSSSTSSTVPSASTFYSQKSLDDPSFTIANTNNNDNKQFFQELCNAAQITRPSRIQSLAWPHVINNENCIIADQTGSGKTLSYLLPLLQKLHLLDTTTTGSRKQRKGCPRIVILTPTAELADQIHSVCTLLSKNLSSISKSTWNFHPFVTTATGSHSTNIRDQIRLLQSTPIDVLISTPGRLSTILRAKNSKLDLGHVASLVLDEVDFLLVDETFGPQLRTVGVAVSSGNENANDNEEGDDGDESQAASLSTKKNANGGPQFIFVTATLPEDVLESITTEFSNIVQLRGPGLHRITPSVQQTLIDVSVPATSNRDARACFDIKVREMLSALRGRRCNKTLIFCNTVETCRNVENVLRRKDRKGRRSRVWAYHNALSPDVRNKNLQSFSRDDDGNDGGGSTESILVCTDRAARGIDFDASPIDHVLLFDFPKDPAGTFSFIVQVMCSKCNLIANCFFFLHLNS